MDQGKKKDRELDECELKFVVKINGQFTNNTIEYEALLRGLEILSELTQLVRAQMSGVNKCNTDHLKQYLKIVNLMKTHIQ